MGTYAGGTAIGWAKAIVDNEKGRLICIDNDTYSANTYPIVTMKNLQRIGGHNKIVQLLNGNSAVLVQRLAEEYPREVDIYLVDGDHTYEGALKDIQSGLPMVKPGGFILVHDVDPGRRMDEMTADHPHPVYEAFHKVIHDNGFNWCILKFIRKHLGIIRVG